MITGNPSLKESTFLSETQVGPNHMTVNGTVNKTFILLLITMFTSYFSYGSTAVLTVVGGVGALVFALLAIFNRTRSMVWGPLYAAFEGLLLGGISFHFNQIYPGIALQAMACTLVVMTSMLFLYKNGYVKVTEKMRSVVTVAAVGVMLFYLVAFLGSLFGAAGMLNAAMGNGLFGIGFSIFMVGLGAFFLLLDFDMIEKGEYAQAPKYLEWYAAFSLMLTLVWLYVEMLRLLSKLRND